MSILDYFDRMAIVHLPDRTDRYQSLKRELSRIGIDIAGPKVSIPDPPMPENANGFTSRGVYGSFLSHLEIIEATIDRPEGHPEGGKVYIDAAYFLFRQLYPDVISVVSSPCFSVQKGSQSSLNSPKWYQRPQFAPVVNLGREIRDEFWRQGWLRIDGPQNVLDPKVEMKSTQFEIWPSS